MEIQQGRSVCVLLAMLLACFSVRAVRAVEISQAEWDQMKKDIEDLRKNPGPDTRPLASTVATALDNKYGPNANVTTKTGKLTIGGLTQVWYYTIQKDSRGHRAGKG